MFRRLLKLNLIPRKGLPQIESRISTIENASSSKLLQADDIVDELRAFTYAKLFATRLAPPMLKTAESLFTELLECDENEAKQIAQREMMDIKTLTMKELRQQIETYIEVGFDRKLLLQYSELLAMNPDIAGEKLEILRQMPNGENGLNDYLPLMKLNINDLKKLRDTLCKDEQMKMEFGNRIHFLSKKLEVEPHIISELFLKNRFLIKLSISKIIENTDLFLRYKVPPQEILRSPYAFKSNIKLKVPLFEHAKSILGENGIRLWFIRASKKNYEKFVKSASENIDPLKEVGVKDNVEYLSKRLGFDIDETQLFLKKYPYVNTIKVRKLKSQLDFLLDEGGYPPEKIVSVPMLFFCSVKTLRKHHEELKKLNHNLDSLHPLTMSSTRWKKYIELVKKGQSNQPSSEE